MQAGIAQLVEQRIENPRVRSSNLRPGIGFNSFTTEIKNPRAAKTRGFLCLFSGMRSACK